MRICSVSTDKYEADICQLMTRRMRRTGYSGQLDCGRDYASAGIGREEDMAAWCSAVAELLTFDLSQFEMAYMVNELPISLEEKKAILPEAVRLSREVDPQPVWNAIKDYFESRDHLKLEGFMAFRMQEQKKQWERCVIRAADQMLLNAEYMELMQVLAAFGRMRAPKIEEIFLILNPDGSCTFTDEDEVRIDYERCTGDGIMSVLVGLAPERITVYDLSGGRSAALAENLMQVFDGRVRFFR